MVNCADCAAAAAAVAVGAPLVLADESTNGVGQVYRIVLAALRKKWSK